MKHMNNKALNSAIFSLHRYFMWANKMRTHFEEKVPTFAQQLKIDANIWTDEGIEAMLYMSYWYGGLYVVIEGWKQLGLEDAGVDSVLAVKTNVYLLKQYRNGVFHYQRDYFDKRFIGFISKGQNAVPWVSNLNKAFGAYFFNWYIKRKLESGNKQTDTL